MKESATSEAARSLAAFAQQHSSYYASLYAGIDVRTIAWDKLPVVDLDAFWRAAADSKLLTGAHRDGVMFKSGGTSGAPKYSWYTRDEWASFTKIFGQGMAQGGSIRDGDRVLNCFYAGQLYASFLFIKDSIEQAPVDVVHLPMSGAVEPAELVAALQDLSVNVLAGVPSSILQLVAYVAEHKVALPKLQRIIFGGESLYPDQRAYISQVLSHVECRSIGWASVDGGLLGFSGDSAEACNDSHHIFSQDTIMELVDEETGALITAKNQRGIILLTNLRRKLMPIIRYPMGDMGCWLDDPVGTECPRIRLLGRTAEAARVGPATVYLSDVRQIVHEFIDELPGAALQLHCSHHDQRDRLVLRIGASCKDMPDQTRDDIALRIKERMLNQRPMLKSLADDGLIHPLAVSVGPLSHLETNARTGKLRILIDERSN